MNIIFFTLVLFPNIFMFPLNFKEVEISDLARMKKNVEKNSSCLPEKGKQAEGESLNRGWYVAV